MFSKFFNFIASVHELSLFAINVRDIRDAAGSAHEAWVICQYASLRQKSAHIDHFRSKWALKDGQLDFLVSNFEDGLFGERLWLFGFDNFKVIARRKHVLDDVIQINYKILAD